MHENYIILTFQNLILFPNQEIKMDFSKKEALDLIDLATAEYNSEIVVVSPKNKENKINIKDLPKIGTLSEIKQIINLPNGSLRVTIRGLRRVLIKDTKFNKNFLETKISKINYPEYNLDLESAYIRKVKSILKEYIEINKNISNSILNITKNINNLGKLTDMISAFLNLDIELKRSLLEEENYYERAKVLIKVISREIKSIEFDKKIDDEIRSDFEQTEKKFIIKEKIECLKRQLEDEEEDIANAYLKQASKLKISLDIKNHIIREINKLSKTNETSPEYGILVSHIDFILGLPWTVSSKDITDINLIDKSFNAAHYGLSKAKERIIEYLILKEDNKEIKCPILCLIGPPGTGKTTFARELAKSINRKFIKISVGGLNDSSELIGHRKAYLGAGPGKIMDGIRRCKVNNPVILIDEVDKMVKDYKGDPASTLLSVLDQNLNKEFIDSYVGEPFDLSKVIFILTANEEISIPSALYDRLEVITVNSYTLYDKLEIAKKYTMPRLSKEYGFDLKQINITDDALIKIATNYTDESGIRDMERKLASIVRKVLIKKMDKKVTISSKDLVKYLGKEKYDDFSILYDDAGIVNVPACRSTGGIVLNIECSIYKSDERVIATGLQGTVMEESVFVALGYIKASAKKFGLDNKCLDNRAVHVHALDGASPKDGPSAGVAITVAILSRLKEFKVPCDIAFTGEISLTGKVLKIGGLKEKLISACNQNITRVFIPFENKVDLDDIPKNVLNKLDIVPVKNFMEVYEQLFM